MAWYTHIKVGWVKIPLLPNNVGKGEYKPPKTNQVVTTGYIKEKCTKNIQNWFTGT